MCLKLVETLLVFLLSIYTLYIATAHFSRFYFSKQYVILELNIEKETALKRTTRSLLEELNSISQKKHSEAIIESRAAHVIDSAINLLSLIKENYSPEQAYELERRLINSIKGGDPNKFVRSIRTLRDNKDTAQSLTVIQGDLKDED